MLRAIRIRKHWTQARLADRLGISQSEMSRRERALLDNCSVEDVEKWAAALNARLVLELRVDGQRPLTDERHAAIQSWLVSFLRAAGWLVEAEVSFNHFGDRGRIDVLAYHPSLGVMLVVEIKTRLDDVQDVLGRLDVKRRVAAQLAKERGWELAAIVPALMFRENRTTRRRLAMHEALFARFTMRARAATAWLRHPTRPIPSGILILVDLPQS